MTRGASHNLAGSLWMTAAMAGFAVEDVFVKAAARVMPLGQVLLLMGLIGVVVFATVSLASGQSPLPRTLFSRTMAVRSGFEIVGRLFYALAVALTPISVASAILQATPLVVVLGAAVLFGERVGLWRWVLIGLGFCGVLVILRPGIAGFDALSLLAVVGLLGFAGRDLATRAAAPTLTTAQLGVAGFVMLAISGVVILIVSGDFAMPDPMGWAMVAGGAGFGLTAYGALTRAMRTGEVAVVTPFRYTRLLFAMALGMTVFHERPDLMTLIGSAMIVLCGVMILTRGRMFTASAQART